MIEGSNPRAALAWNRTIKQSVTAEANNGVSDASSLEWWSLQQSCVVMHRNQWHGISHFKSEYLFFLLQWVSYCIAGDLQTMGGSFKSHNYPMRTS